MILYDIMIISVVSNVKKMRKPVQNNKQVAWGVQRQVSKCAGLDPKITIWGVPKMEVPQKGRFIMRIPVKMI